MVNWELIKCPKRSKCTEYRSVFMSMIMIVYTVQFQPTVLEFLQ